MACCCELQNTPDVEVTQDALLDVEIGGSAGVLLQAKSVEIIENGTSVVAPDDGFDGLKGVEIDTNVPKRFDSGDAIFDTNNYSGGGLEVKLITKINVSYLVTSKITSLKSMFDWNSRSLTEIIGAETWDTSNVTNMCNIFSNCHALKKVCTSGWDTSKVAIFDFLFTNDRALKSVDFSSWDFSNCSKASNFRHPLSGCSSLSSIIGDKKLQDVENGTVSMRGLRLSLSVGSSPLRFSSILALTNGLADLTGATAQTLTISANSYKYMYNDDDTKPTAEVIAERQARIAAICAAKNWNFAH